MSMTPEEMGDAEENEEEGRSESRGRSSGSKQEGTRENAADLMPPIPQGGPVWATGMSILITALVGFVLALGLDIGGMTTTYINSKIDERQRELTIESEQSRNDAVLQQNTILTMQQATESQTIQIADLMRQKTALENDLYRLQLQYDQLIAVCPVSIAIPTPAISTPLPFLAPTPSSNRQVVPLVTPSPNASPDTGVQ